MEKSGHDGQVVEVTEKAKRRRHSAAYKLRILQEADACKKLGELGALLRREGLYSSHLAAWRNARANGGARALEPKQRGPKVKVVDPGAQLLAKQSKELTRWKARAEFAEALVEIKKTPEVCGPEAPGVDRGRLATSASR